MIEKVRYRARIKPLNKHKLVSCIDFLLDEIECVEIIEGKHKALRFNFKDVVLEQATDLLAAKSYRGDKPEDKLVFEGDKIIDGMGRVGVVKWHEETAAFASEFINPTGIHKFTLFSANTMKAELLEIIGTVHDRTEAANES